MGTGASGQAAAPYLPVTTVPQGQPGVPGVKGGLVASELLISQKLGTGFLLKSPDLYTDPIKHQRLRYVDGTKEMKPSHTDLSRVNRIAGIPIHFFPNPGIPPRDPVSPLSLTVLPTPPFLRGPSMPLLCLLAWGRGPRLDPSGDWDKGVQRPSPPPVPFPEGRGFLLWMTSRDPSLTGSRSGRRGARGGAGRLSCSLKTPGGRAWGGRGAGGALATSAARDETPRCSRRPSDPATLGIVLCSPGSRVGGEARRGSRAWLGSRPAAFGPGATGAAAPGSGRRACGAGRLSPRSHGLPRFPRRAHSRRGQHPAGDRL